MGGFPRSRRVVPTYPLAGGGWVCDTCRRGGERPCICGTRFGARTARRTSTGGWCARCGATARSCRRRWRSSASWTPRAGPRRRRWRGRSPGAASSGSCSRSRRLDEATVPVRLDRHPPGARPVVRRRVAGLDAVAGAAAGRAVRGAAAARPGGGAVVGDGRGAGDRAAVRAVERAAHRGGLVPPDGARGSAGAACRAGQRRSALPGAGSLAAPQGRRSSSTW